MLTNFERAKAVMRQNGLDALVATTPENVAYLTGFWILSILRHRTRQVFAVITPESDKADIVISRGLADGAITQNARVNEYHLYGNFFLCDHSRDGADAEAARFMTILDNSPAYPGAVEALAGCLTRRGAASGRIGLDQGTDAVGLGTLLKTTLPGIASMPAYDLFRQIRICKTEAEVDRIRKAIAITEGALGEAIMSIGEGVGEDEVALAFTTGVARRGGLQSLDCIGSGPRGAFPSVGATSRKIRRGDVVRFDVGCIADCYHADMARIAVLGEPLPKVQRYHDAITAGEKAIIAAMKPGVATADLFRLGVETVRKAGIPHYERTHCGHGNGIEGYDLPQISPSDKTILEPGMVLCVETPYYEPGFAGIQIEDIVVIREQGAERLTTLEQKLFVV